MFSSNVTLGFLIFSMSVAQKTSFSRICATYVAQIDMSKIYMPMWIHLCKDNKFSRPDCPKWPALRQRPLSRPLKAAIERVPLG